MLAHIGRKSSGPGEPSKNNFTCIGQNILLLGFIKYLFENKKPERQFTCQTIRSIKGRTSNEYLRMSNPQSNECVKEMLDNLKPKMRYTC